MRQLRDVLPASAGDDPPDIGVHHSVACGQLTLGSAMRVGAPDRAHVRFAQLPGLPDLNNLRRPAAVLGRVVSVAVDAVNRVLRRRARPYVLQEVLEAVEPAVAHTDTFAAVVLVVWPRRIGASLLHVLPAVVLGGSRSTVRNRCFAPVAAARSAVAATELATDNNRGHAARAATMPRRLSVRVASGAAHHCEAPEDHPAHVYSWSGHDGNIMVRRQCAAKAA